MMSLTRSCAPAQLPPAVMGTYNIGAGVQTTVSEVYRLIADAVGVSSPPRYAAVRTGEVHAIALDSTEARRGTRVETLDQTRRRHPAHHRLATRPNVNRYRPPCRCVKLAQLRRDQLDA